MFEHSPTCHWFSENCHQFYSILSVSWAAVDYNILQSAVYSISDKLPLDQKHPIGLDTFSFAAFFPLETIMT